MQVPSMEVDDLGKRVDEELPVTIVMDDVATFVSPTGHVPDRTLMLEAQRSCHVRWSEAATGKSSGRRRRQRCATQEVHEE
jgi:hypothetical protein